VSNEDLFNMKELG